MAAVETHRGRPGMFEPQRYRAYMEVVGGRRRDLVAVALRGLLRLASIPYGLAVLLRNKAYDWGLLRAGRLPVPVISVGNITTGGTGKTPLVEYLARWLRRRGVRVVVLSRGYGPPPLPEDRAAEAGNDETDLLARNLPDVPQLVDPDRLRIGFVAVDELAAECLILDDGFQHRRLVRDLDLVTVDALNPFGFGHLLPRGLLREGPRALRRADLIVLTRCDQAEDLAGLRRRLRRLAPQAPLVETRHAPLHLVDPVGATAPTDWLAGRPVVAVCGIGNPEAFRRTLLDCGADIRSFLVFPDHHLYLPGEREEVARTLDRVGAHAVLTTQKDLPKLVGVGRPDGSPSPLASRTVWALRVELQVTAGGEALEERLKGVLAVPARQPHRSADQESESTRKDPAE